MSRIAFSSSTMRMRGRSSGKWDMCPRCYQKASLQGSAERSGPLVVAPRRRRGVACPRRSRRLRRRLDLLLELRRLLGHLRLFQLLVGLRQLAVDLGLLPRLGVAHESAVEL